MVSYTLGMNPDQGGAFSTQGADIRPQDVSRYTRYKHRSSQIGNS